MAIMCLKHPDCEATFICLQCGFLCAMDIKDENKRKHNPLYVSDSIKDLYEALLSQREAKKQSELISQLKKSMIIYLDQERYASKQKAAIAISVVDKCLSEIEGINIQTLRAILEQTINMNHKNAHKCIETKNEILDKLISGFLESKAESKKIEKIYAYKTISGVINLNKVQPKKKFKNLKLQKITTHCQICSKKNKKSNLGLKVLNEINLGIYQKHKICIANNWESYQSRNAYTKVAEIHIENERKSCTKAQSIGKIIKSEENIEKTKAKAIKQYSENEWEIKYGNIVKKYDSQNPNVLFAANILLNKQKKEGKIIIKNLCEKMIGDDGAIAIGYMIRKNNTLQQVSITSDIPIRK